MSGLEIAIVGILFCAVAAAYCFSIFKTSHDGRVEEKMPAREVLPIRPVNFGLRKYQKSINLLYDHFSLLPGELDRSNRLFFYVQLTGREDEPDSCVKLFRDRTLGEFLIDHQGQIEKVWLVVETIMNFEEVNVTKVTPGDQIVSWIHNITFLRINKVLLKKMLLQYHNELSSK